MNARLPRFLAIVFAAAVASPAMAGPLASGDSAGTARGVDQILNQENEGKKVLRAPLVDDMAFLRRAYVDVIGRIPTDAEITAFLALPAEERRTRVVDELIKRDSFADRWSVFYGDLLRVRSRNLGGEELQAFVHEALQTNMPFDVLARKFIGANGKAGFDPETAFLLDENADPMALTGIIAQVFLGVRMQCAQCHDHPFDTWKRHEFYEMAAYLGKTRKYELRINNNNRVLGTYLQETQQTSVMWPPEDKAKGKPRNPVPPQFPYKLDAGDGPNQHIARLNALRAKQAAAAAAKAKQAKAANDVEDLLNDTAGKLKTVKKAEPIDVARENKASIGKIDSRKDAFKPSDLRAALAKHVTDPRNRYFSQAIVNRVWNELLGRGFVNAVDDFKDDNPPSHPRTLDFLADEFVASGYDMRFLVKAIVLTDTYRVGHLPPSVPAPERIAAEQEFTSLRVRRLVSEALFDSIVSAGHLFQFKHKAGENIVLQSTTIRMQVPVETKPGAIPKLSEKPALGGEMQGQAMPAMASTPAAPSGYDLERGIEVNFKAALMKKKDDVPLEAMKAPSKDDLEAEMAMKMEMQKKAEKAATANAPKTKTVLREVKTAVDDNPVFVSAMRMAAPAPRGHFLRVFGQTERTELDPQRDDSPSMRQSLMMLNGKLTNEAARVGSREPMHKLLSGPKPDLHKAIRLAYREILTREPATDEITEAKSILAAAATPQDGMADLRWALFNCNEFRYLP